MQLLSGIKPKIKKRLEQFLKHKAESYKSYGYGADIYEKLFSYASSGKVIRGSLLIGAAKQLYGIDDEKLIDWACAIELLHSAFLIQDDIMDNDTKRRGMDAMHIQYKSTDLAICLSDLAIFLAYELLDQKAIHFANDILIRTGLGQMMDIHPASLEPQAVEQVYEAKTAYYTFYLPLGLAAISAGEEPSANVLELSKKLGYIFQITDDILGLQGDPEKTGKAVGSDINERRYTLYISYLFEHANLEDKKRLEVIYTHKTIDDKDKKFVQSLIEKYDVTQYLQEQITLTVTQINTIIEKDANKAFFIELTNYLVSRWS